MIRSMCQPPVDGAALEEGQEHVQARGTHRNKAKGTHRQKAEGKHRQAHASTGAVH